MKGTLKGQYVIKNPKKYMGNANNVIYRSSWELLVFRFLDTKPSVLSWCSEGIQIPYYNPFTKRQTVYIPDLLIVFEVKGKRWAEMVEIKPLKEVPGVMAEDAKMKKLSTKDKAAQVLNAAKWQAAMAFCKKRGIRFRIMTERDLGFIK
jgi:hypothetical protein